MAKIYTVVLPITGTVTVEVESDVKLSDKEAIQKAIDDGEYSIEDIQGWEALKCVVQGNVFYGAQNEAEVIKVEDDETDEEDGNDLDDE